MKESLSELYVKKLKEYLIPIAILLLSVFIIFQVMIPQFHSLNDTNVKISEKQVVVRELEDSYNALTNIADTDLKKHLSISELTLPVTKTVVEAYLNLINASIKTDIVLKRFTLNAGNILDKTKKKTDGKKNALPNYTYEGSVDLQSSSIDNIKEFSTILHSTIPVIQIKSIDMSENEGLYELVFHFRPYDLEKLSKETTIKPLSQQELELLQKLDEWSRKLEES